MNTSVLVVGAGPVGSALALDLARRGVSVRIVDRATQSFPGSRAKGVQPRTQEVLEDLGVLPDLLYGASAYPRLGIHMGPLTVPKSMFKSYPASEAVPYPNIVLSPQSNTDAVLHRALDVANVSVEYGQEVTGVSQDAHKVTTTLHNGISIVSDYVVGADGGASAVRKAAGITFTGATDEDDHMIIADLPIPGLRRDRWHIWPGRAGRFLGACPLPDGNLFQIMLRLPKGAEIDRNPTALEAAVRAALVRKRLTPGEFEWVSLFRPNIRLAEEYRHGRIFLAGDSAHSHTPAGGQGLNTEVQDAYNLGWKLGQVLSGAPEALLATYEAERRPIAAGVLKLSTDRYQAFEGDAKKAITRGDEERQLLVNYRSGPLALSGDVVGGSLAAGDRLPDAAIGEAGRVFELLAGPDFGLLAIGINSSISASIPSVPGARVRVIELPLGAYETTTPSYVLVRPDGYVAAVSMGDHPGAILEALRKMRPQST